MRRRPFRVLAPILAATVVVLPLGLWLANTAWGVRFQGDSILSDAPVALLPSSDRDVGTITQGAVLRIAFPIANAGTRRLIVTEAAATCCGRPANDGQIVLAPGESTNLNVSIETIRWCGQLDHAVRYLTNDPRLPQFTLKVTGDVRPAVRP